MKNSKNEKYLTASIYYLIGNIIGQGVILLSSIIFTRVMSKDAYGLVNTYSAWVLVINTFIGLNLFITVRNAYIDYYDDYKKYVSSVMAFSLLSFFSLSILILGIIIVFGIHVDIFVIFLALVQGISVHTINYQMAIYSMENQYQLRTMLMVAPNVLHTALSVILVIVYSENQYYGKIIGNAVGLFVFALGIIIVLFKTEKPQFIKQYWKYAAVISVPAIMQTLSDLILMQSDRIMLTNIIGAKETAVYSLVYNIGSILIALYTAVNGSWTPWFYTRLELGEFERIKKVQTIYIGIFTFLTMELLTISPEIIKILSPETYWSGINYVNLIVIASFLIFLYAFFTTYLMYLKRTGSVALNTVIAAGLNLLLNDLLIPEYSAVGASLATIISYIVLFILHWRSVNKYGGQVLSVHIIIISICLVILYSILFYFIRNQWVIRYSIVFITGLAALWFGLKAYKNKKFFTL